LGLPETESDSFMDTMVGVMTGAPGMGRLHQS
jgi:hypothetical protein